MAFMAIDRITIGFTRKRRAAIPPLGLKSRGILAAIW
jgi:hypothetical protein